MSLNDRQELFVREYLVDLNATDAAKRAGYSEKTAYSQGQRLLKNVEVEAAIRKQRDARAERLEISADRIDQELARIAFADMADFTEMGANGVVKFKDWAELGENATRVVSELVQDVTGGAGKAARARTKFKLHDKIAALRLLSQRRGELTERQEHSGPGGGPIEVVDVNERADRIRRIVESVRARSAEHGGDTGDRGVPGPSGNGHASGLP